MSVQNISIDNFDNLVLKSDKTVLVDFYADWCGPCKMTAPIIESLSEEHNEFSFAKCNVDNEFVIASRFNIMSIPTLIVFKDGKAVKTHVGAASKEEILKLFE